MDNLLQPLISILKIGAGIIILSILCHTAVWLFKKIKNIINRKEVAANKFLELVRSGNLGAIREITPELKHYFIQNPLPFFNSPKDFKKYVDAEFSKIPFQKLPKVQSHQLDIARTLSVAGCQNEDFHEVWNNFSENPKLTEILEILSSEKLTTDVSLFDTDKLIAATYEVSNKRNSLSDFNFSVRTNQETVSSIAQKSLQKQKETFRKLKQLENPLSFKELKGILGKDDLTHKAELIDLFVVIPKEYQEDLTALAILRASHGIRVFISETGDPNSVPSELPLFWYDPKIQWEQAFQDIDKQGLLTMREVALVKDFSVLTKFSKIDPEISESHFTEYFNRVEDRNNLADISIATQETAAALNRQTDILENQTRLQNVQIALSLGQTHQLQHLQKVLTQISEHTSSTSKGVAEITRSHLLSTEKMIKEIDGSGKITRRTVSVEWHRK